MVIARFNAFCISPFSKDVFTILTKRGRHSSRHSLSKVVGRGSKEHDFDGDAKMNFFSCAGDTGENSVYPDKRPCSLDMGVDDTGIESRSDEIRLIFSLKYVAKLSATSLLLSASSLP